MDKFELMARTKQFAVRVFKLMDRLPKSEAAKVVTYQLLKSSSSVAANYRAANRGKSDADFINKIKIVLEEADESYFWLTFLSDVELLKKDDKELELLVKESNELTAIFTASLKTLNQKNLKIKSKT
jgi:four helix bundle protein